MAAHTPTFKLSGVMVPRAHVDLNPFHSPMPANAFELAVQDIMDREREETAAAKVYRSLHDLNAVGTGVDSHGAEESMHRYFQEQLRLKQIDDEETLKHTGYSTEDLRRMAVQDRGQYANLLAGAQRAAHQYGVPAARALEAHLVNTGHLDRSALDRAIGQLGATNATAAANQAAAGAGNAGAGRAADAAGGGGGGGGGNGGAGGGTGPDWRPDAFQARHAANAPAAAVAAPPRPVAAEQRGVAAAEAIRMGREQAARQQAQAREVLARARADGIAQEAAEEQRRRQQAHDQAAADQAAAAARGVAATAARARAVATPRSMHLTPTATAPSPFVYEANTPTGSSMARPPARQPTPVVFGADDDGMVRAEAERQAKQEHKDWDARHDAVKARKRAKEHAEGARRMARREAAGTKPFDVAMRNGPVPTLHVPAGVPQQWLGEPSRGAAGRHIAPSAAAGRYRPAESAVATALVAAAMGGSPSSIEQAAARAGAGAGGGSPVAEGRGDAARARYEARKAAEQSAGLRRHRYSAGIPAPLVTGAIRNKPPRHRGPREHKPSAPKKARQYDEFSL